MDLAGPADRGWGVRSSRECARMVMHQDMEKVHTWNEAVACLAHARLTRTGMCAWCDI